MLRLDPAHPVLWRPGDRVQFGAPAIVALAGVTAWQERVVRMLHGGTTRAAAVGVARSLGATPTAVEAFLDALSPVLQCPTPVPHVRVQLPFGLPLRDRDAVLAAIDGSGAVALPEDWCGEPDEPPSDATPMIVVAHHLVEHRRVRHLMRHDVPHLPLVIRGREVQVGPLIVPGETGCLLCETEHARDADSEWPFLEAQLAASPPAAPPVSLVYEAACVAVRMLVRGAEARDVGARSVTGSDVARARSVTLHAGSGRRTWQVHPPHATCLCRSLAGIATADAPPVPFRAPTTATAFARPA